MLRRPFHSRQTVGGIDQGKVGQRLWEIANEPLFSGIMLFGKETHIISKGQKSSKKCLRLAATPLDGVSVCEPK